MYINDCHDRETYAPKVVFNCTRDGLHLPLALLVIEIHAVCLSAIYSNTICMHRRRLRGGDGAIAPAVKILRGQRPRSH